MHYISTRFTSIQAVNMCAGQRSVCSRNESLDKLDSAKLIYTAVQNTALLHNFLTFPFQWPPFVYKTAFELLQSVSQKPSARAHSSTSKTLLICIPNCSVLFAFWQFNFQIMSTSLPLTADLKVEERTSHAARSGLLQTLKEQRFLLKIIFEARKVTLLVKGKVTLLLTVVSRSSVCVYQAFSVEFTLTSIHSPSTLTVLYNVSFTEALLKTKTHKLKSELSGKLRTSENSINRNSKPVLQFNAQSCSEKF